MKILVVEDDRPLAASLQTLLEDRGYEVECAYDGEAGAQYARLGVYDLMILDVMLPKLDGRQVARQLRAERCAVPILMLTARSGLEDRVEGLDAGADYYLAKPFDTRELLACAARGGRWTSWCSATRRWTWLPPPWPAGSDGCGCPPGSST